MDKDLQRKMCLYSRDSLDMEKREEYSKIICQRLFDMNIKGNIMSYYPVRSEVDILPFNFSKYVCYPVIMTDKQMEIYLPIENRFSLNYYKIPEPDTSVGIKVEKGFISTVIVPLVGFDENLHRLGYGGGYYDRFLKDMDVKKIGVAFEAQKTEYIETSEYDIKLDCIVTEEKIYE